jgi:hypothetical protein
MPLHIVAMRKSQTSACVYGGKLLDCRILNYSTAPYSPIDGYKRFGEICFQATIHFRVYSFGSLTLSLCYQH